MKKLILGSMACVLTQGTLANEFHHENFPVGDQPSALAGAYTANSGSTYSMHYNPAGISGIGEQVSGTLNAFTHSSTSFDEVFLTATDVSSNGQESFNEYSYDSLDRTSNTAIPGFLGYTMQWQQLTIGGYLATPDISYEELADSGDFSLDTLLVIDLDNDDVAIENGLVQESRSLSVDSEFKTTQAGVSAAYNFSDSLSAGFTLSGHIKNKKEIYTLATHYQEQATDIDFDKTQSLQEATRIIDSEISVIPKLGILWKGDRFDLGLTLSQKQSLSRTLKYDYQSTSLDLASSTDLNLKAIDDPYVQGAIRFESNDKQNYPLELAIGISSQLNSKNKVALDIHHYGATSKQNKFFLTDAQTVDGDPMQVATTRTFKSVTNLALAWQNQITGQNTVIIGAFTDFSNSDINLHEDTANYSLYTAHEDIDMFGLSLSVHHKSADYNVTTGIIASHGSGDAASYELLAFGGGENEGSENTYQITRTNLNVFFGIQY